MTSNPWVDAPSMVVPHSEHTATVLGGPQCRAAPAAPWCGKVLVAGGFGASELYDPLIDRWDPTGPMTVIRSYHTASLLDGTPCRDSSSAPAWCGTVLVTGGGGDYADSDKTTARTELYDPSTGTWRMSAPMRTKRAFHTATVLDDGRVLVAGGLTRTDGDYWRAGGGPPTPMGGAEIYDPAADAWSDAAPASASPETTAVGAGAAESVTLGGPTCATATPPPWCGRALVTWETDTGRPGTSPAALYDPAAGSWTRAGAPPVVRAGSRLTLLADGSVLLTGGDGAAVHRYDPSTSTWRPVAPMGSARERHQAILLGGARCATSPSPPCGQVLVVGGAAGAPAELYDAGADAWRPTGGALPNRRGLSASPLPDGRVLVAGGDVDPNVGAYLSSALLYVPMASGGPPVATAIGPSRGPATGRGEVVIRGEGLRGVTGVRFGDVDAASYRVESSTRLLAVAPPHAAGTVPVSLSMGGRAAAAAPARLAYTFVEPPELPEPTVRVVDPPTSDDGAPTTVTVSGSGFLFGPAETQVTFGAARATQVTVLSESLLEAVSPPGNGVVHVSVATPAGTSPAGLPDDGRPAPTAFAYGEGSWSADAPLPDGECPQRQTSPGFDPAPCHGRYWATATVLDGPPCRRSSPPGWCGQVLVTGGATTMYCGPDGEAVRTSELYDPRTGRWTSTGSLLDARYEHTATLLADGRVLVAGGKGSSGCEGLATAEVYDPSIGVWSRAGGLAQGRFAHTATLFDGPACDISVELCGHVLLTGGAGNERGRGSLASAELFDPARLVFTTTARMQMRRANHTATLLETGEVLIVGGLGGEAGGDEGGVAAAAGGWGAGHSITQLASAELFRPDRPSFRATGNLGVGRMGHTATVLRGPRCGSRCGQVLVVGGGEHGIQATPLGFVDITTVAPGSDRFLLSGEVFDPASGTWAPTPLPTWPRGGHSATLLADGRVLLAGGGPPGPIADEGFFRATPTAEIFDPQTSTWSPTGTLHTARGLHAAVLLDGPACRADGGADAGRVRARPEWCGSVLALGGATSGNGHSPPALASVERYAAGPPQVLRPAPEAAEGGGPAVAAVVGAVAGLLAAVGVTVLVVRRGRRKERPGRAEENRPQTQRVRS